MGRFDYVKYDEIAVGQQADAKKICEDLEAMIKRLDQGRYTALALTALEDVYTQIGKAVRDEQLKIRPQTFSMVCGVDCKPGTALCNGYCRGESPAPKTYISPVLQEERKNS